MIARSDDQTFIFRKYDNDCIASLCATVDYGPWTKKYYQLLTTNSQLKKTVDYGLLTVD